MDPSNDGRSSYAPTRTIGIGCLSLFLCNLAGWIAYEVIVALFGAERVLVTTILVASAASLVATVVATVLVLRGHDL